MVTEREKIVEGAVRMVRTQGESATKPKPVEEKDTENKRGKGKLLRRVTKKNRKNFSVLQEEDTEKFLEEEEPPRLTK